jgi:hypothetical protein
LAYKKQAKSRALLAGEAFTLDGLLQSEGRPEEARNRTKFGLQ